MEGLVFGILRYIFCEPVGRVKIQYMYLFSETCCIFHNNLSQKGGSPS